MNWRDIYAAMYVATSRITGKGLFAGTRVTARAKIGEFEGERIGLREARRRAKTLTTIAIVELDRIALDSTTWRHGFRFINHSCSPNTFMRITPKRAEFYALRAIRKGEELTVDYGRSHHDGKLPCRCGAKACRGFI